MYATRSARSEPHHVMMVGKEPLCCLAPRSGYILPKAGGGLEQAAGGVVAGGEAPREAVGAIDRVGVRRRLLRVVETAEAPDAEHVPPEQKQANETS